MRYFTHLHFDFQHALSEQTDDQRRKWELKENRAHNETLRAQDKYAKAVNELHGDKDRYVRDMHNQFGHAQVCYNQSLYQLYSFKPDIFFKNSELLVLGFREVETRLFEAKDVDRF